MNDADGRRSNSMRRVCIAIACLALVGCAGGADKWTKPGVTPDMTETELSDCESEAHSATQRDAGIDADILASRGQDWQRAGTLGLKRDDMANSNRARSAQIVARCMAAKGYRPAP
jgi:hypothetical protein